MKILDEIVDRLRRVYDPGSIYLFGSRAWGEPREDSDYDLLVIVPESDERPIKREVRGLVCLQGLPIFKDLIVKTREEFPRYAGVCSSLESDILRRGKVLYERSETEIGLGDTFIRRD